VGKEKWAADELRGSHSRLPSFVLSVCGVCLPSLSSFFLGSHFFFSVSWCGRGERADVRAWTPHLAAFQKGVSLFFRISHLVASNKYQVSSLEPLGLSSSEEGAKHFSVPEPTGALCPTSHPTMERQAGLIQETWAGQTRRAGCTPPSRTATSGD
jgi:hypothetical protein